MAISVNIQSSPIAAVVSNPRLADNPIIDCNQAFMDLTGYDRSEILGRNCRFLAGEGTEPDLTETIRTGVRNRQPVLVEILNYKKNGTPFRNAVMVVPIFDPEGELEFFLGSQVEVSTAVSQGAPERRQIASDKVAFLSRRQREVLIQMASGKLNKQIAYDMGLSERTVKMHRAAVLKTLDVRTSADAIRVAVEAGF